MSLKYGLIVDENYGFRAQLPKNNNAKSQLRETRREGKIVVKFFFQRLNAASIIFLGKRSIQAITLR